MHSGNKKNKLLKTGAKIAGVIVIILSVYSPFQQLLQAPLAQAISFIPASSPTYVADYRSSLSLEARDEAAAAKAAASTNDTAMCNSFGSCIAGVVYVFTAGIGSWVAYIAGYFFSVAVGLSLQGPIYALDFITIGWKTVRDVANMAFIFILIYLAFTIILRAETSKTLSTLAAVVVIALVVNFSFFMTRVVIDIGNISAVQFYNAIDVKGATTLGGSKDLTASIMQGINVQGILNGKSFKTWQEGPNYGFLTELVTLSVIYVFTGAIFFVLAAAFAAAAVKFVFRIAILWFAIIVSPLAFVAKTLHETQNYYEEWQSMLIKHAFYPAIFLFVYWILTIFASHMSIDDAFSQLSNGTSGGSGFLQLASIIAQVTIRMGFIIAVLYIGLQAAEKIGVYGAKAAQGFSSKLVFGLPAFAMRSTAGWAGNAISRLAPTRGWASRDNLIGKTLWRGVDKLGSSSFDVRRPLGAVGLDYGKPTGKGGYQQMAKDRARRLEDEGKKMEATAGQKAAADEKIQGEFGVSIAAATKAQKEATAAQKKALEAFEKAENTLRNYENNRTNFVTDSSGNTVPVAMAIRNARGQQTDMKRVLDRANLALGEKSVTKREVTRRYGQLTGDSYFDEKGNEVKSLKQQYADNISKTKPTRWWVPQTNREATAKLRQKKSNAERAWDEIKKEVKEEEHENEPHGEEPTPKTGGG